jgi:hypothetical protein
MLKQKVLSSLALYVLWIILGLFGVLPTFSGSYLGQSMATSHSVFIIVPALLDLAIYVLITQVLVEVIFSVLKDRK